MGLSRTCITIWLTQKSTSSEVVSLVGVACRTTLRACSYHAIGGRVPCQGTRAIAPWRSTRSAPSVPYTCRPPGDRTNLDVQEGFQQLNCPVNIVTEIEPV